MLSPANLHRRALPLTCVAAALLSCNPAPLAGQSANGSAITSPDTVSVVPGARFRASPVYSYLFGREYRQLWTEPVRVEVLDLHRFAGGLTPVRRGGGNQTKSLRFRGADGREYAFRSVEKDPANLEPELRETFAGHVIRDQSKSYHPAAPIVVAPLLEAVGVLHAAPKLVVLPDDAVLGEYRADFAGMLGVIEERPNEGTDGEPGFAGARQVVSTERMLERIEASSAERVEARAYLTARLMDILLGDWDRHEDQWRWALLDREDGTQRWYPIPRDRDQALVKFDGLLLNVARQQYPKVVNFDRKYGNLHGLTQSAARLDRRLLSELPRPVWESTVAQIQAALTDAVIEDAVRRMPAEFYARSGEDLSRTLKVRRDRLGDAATRYYRTLAATPDIHATDQRDLAVVERLDARQVSVQLYSRNAAGAEEAEPYYQRVFDRDETREIRLYLHGGADRAVIRGDVSRSILVRVHGGGGGDELVDSSRVAGRDFRTAFYDSRGENQFVRGSEAVIDVRPYAPPPLKKSRIQEPHRDWGSRRFIMPSLDYNAEQGLVLGGGTALYRYGFRQVPYASRTSFAAAYAPTAQTGALRYEGRFYRQNSGMNLSVLAQASGLERSRFYGFGNDVTPTEPQAFYQVREREVRVEPALNFPLWNRTHLTVGPIFQHQRTDLNTGTLLAEIRPYGSGSFGQIGLRSGVELDTRDHSVAATRGVRVAVGGTLYPAAWDVVSTFGEAHGEVSTFLSAPVPTQPTLALRMGGKQLWGEAPFHEMARLGGSRTLRGYAEDRFSGDAAVYGNAELRLQLSRFEFLFPGRFGALLLADAGRVEFEGRSPGGWHTAYGGGLWAYMLDPAFTLRAFTARGADETKFYVGVGFLF